MPSVGELTKQADSAFAEAAAEAPRRADDVIGAVVHDAFQAIRDWAEKVFKELEFVSFSIEVKGDDLVLYGIGSKYALMRANVKSVKVFVVEKSESMMRLLKSRQARLPGGPRSRVRRRPASSGTARSW